MSGGIRIYSTDTVIQNILTKGDRLSGSDIKMLQTAMNDAGVTDIDYPNGVLGPQTVQGIVDYVGSIGQEMLASRLSRHIVNGIEALDNGAEFLDKIATIAEENPSDLSHHDVNTLLHMPFALTREELKSVQTQLGIDDAKGNMGSTTASRVLSYLENNPEALTLQNPTITDYLYSQGEFYQDALRDIAKTSGAYENVTNILIEQSSDDRTPGNYHLQMQLRAGGYTLSRPDGVAGDGTQESIDEFRKDHPEGSKLEKAWDNKGQLQANAHDVTGVPLDLNADSTPKVV